MLGDFTLLVRQSVLVSRCSISASIKHLAQRQIPGPLSETLAGGGFSVAPLPRRCRGAQYTTTVRKQHKRQKISQEEMLQRYVSHIPTRYLKWCGTTVFGQPQKGLAAAEGLRRAGYDGTGKTEATWVRSADERFPGHGSVPVYPVKGLATFCRYRGRRAHHQTAL